MRNFQAKSHGLKIVDEMESAVLDLSRVTRVQRGGKRMRFRATVAIGNKKGKVGVGTAKGADVSLAIQKATYAAKKHVISVPIARGTIPHSIVHKFKAAHILVKPARPGTGIIAGGVMRTLLELCGVENAVAKSFGSKSKINVARATLEAFRLVTANTARIVSSRA